MHIDRAYQKLVASSLLSLLLTASTFAGVNANFEVAVNPERIEVREIGQTFDIVVLV